MIDYRENAEKISLLKSLRRVELGWPTHGKVTHCVSFSMPLKFSSTFHSSVWTENFQMFNAHNSLSQPVHLSTTVHARYPFCSLLQSFDRSSLLRILRLLKGLRLDWFLAILFKAEVQLFRLRLRRTGWRKVARRYLAFTSYFSSHSRVMLTSSLHDRGSPKKRMSFLLLPTHKTSCHLYVPALPHGLPVFRDVLEIT